jgi:aryl-alcohol dehydrogenase-like predicted oxidoreductase
MERKQFGNTQLMVTKIGLGLAALGRPGYINLGHAVDLNHNYDQESMESHAHQIMELAYNKGIRYFDAARSYGKAEEFLANWAGNHKDITIGSKWGYTYTADWKVKAEHHEIKEHSINILKCQWQETLNTLHHSPDIYHIHSASMESGVLENNQVLDYLWELRENGLIVGLSLSGARQAETLERSLEIKSSSKQLFQSVQITWNILERSATDSISKAVKAGYGIIVKEALANGRLTTRNTVPDFQEKFNVISGIAESHHVGVDAIAIAYILNQSWISTVLSGAAQRSHLESNLDALRIGLDPTEIEKLDQLAESPEKYWKTRSELEWN